MNTTHPLFADRVHNIPESFIREILKVSTQQDMISFAGGLPNPNFFPTDKLAQAAEKVFRDGSRTALQYAPTEGYLPLRDYIAHRQGEREGRTIQAEDVIMLNGSQQGLDLSGKLFLNTGTPILLEEPSYLGAIQAFSAYEPFFHSVKLDEEGPDFTDFIHKTRKAKPKFFYCIPNFQNPTGESHSVERRIKLMESQAQSDMLWIEDNPYGEIFFEKNARPDFHGMMPHKTIHLGSFSKIISPGLRLGWAIGPKEIIKKMAIAKQASDLHSNNLAQRIVYQFLIDYSLDDHLQSIRSFYRSQAEHMMNLMSLHFPSSISWSKPGGGMFLWVTLPLWVKASEVLVKAIHENVLFVPGENFYVEQGKGTNTLRMNFSNPTSVEIEKGISILARLFKDAMAHQHVVVS